jgi:hypothetical protein
MSLSLCGQCTGEQQRAEPTHRLCPSAPSPCGAQVALQRGPILRSGRLILHPLPPQWTPFRLAAGRGVNMTDCQWTFPLPKSGHFEPSFCGHLILPLTQRHINNTMRHAVAPCCHPAWPVFHRPSSCSGLLFSARQRDQFLRTVVGWLHSV